MSAMTPITTIDHHVLALLDAGCNGLTVDEVAGDAMFLHCLGDRCEWFIETSFGQLHITPPAEDARVGEGWLAVSERVRRFARVIGAEEVSLGLVDDSTIVATDGVMSAAIDLVPHQGDYPTVHKVHSTARVSLPMRTFAMLIDAARSLPSGVEGGKRPMPPLWLHIGGGTLGLHVDWNDFLPNRATYRVNTPQQTGEATVAVPHVDIDRFVDTLAIAGWDLDEDVIIEVGTVREGSSERGAITFQNGWWRMLLWLENPLEFRWGTRIDETLDEAAGLRVIDRDTAEWIVSNGQHEVRLVLHRGHPDIARVSVPLVQQVTESLELLRELGQLNASSDGVRFWFADGTVFAAADVPCTDLGSLPRGVHRVIEAKSRFGPLLAVFGESGLAQTLPF